MPPSRNFQKALERKYGVFTALLIPMDIPATFYTISGQCVSSARNALLWWICSLHGLLHEMHIQAVSLKYRFCVPLAAIFSQVYTVKKLQRVALADLNSHLKLVLQKEQTQYAGIVILPVRYSMRLINATNARHSGSMVSLS